MEGFIVCGVSRQHALLSERQRPDLVQQLSAPLLARLSLAGLPEVVPDSLLDVSRGQHVGRAECLIAGQEGQGGLDDIASVLCTVWQRGAGAQASCHLLHTTWCWTHASTPHLGHLSHPHPQTYQGRCCSTLLSPSLWPEADAASAALGSFAGHWPHASAV